MGILGEARAELSLLLCDVDLEDALGKPFPVSQPCCKSLRDQLIGFMKNIAVAVHILWRLDTLLLNLGLTLVISAFYFNTEPIYHRLPLRHDVSHARHGQKTFGDLSPHRLFPLVVVGIYLVHFAISWVWAAAVRRVGLSAVTWGVSSRLPTTCAFITI